MEPSDSTDSECNERGNAVQREYHPFRERYYYDFELCTPEEGWLQYELQQDAPRFGVWVRPGSWEIMVFDEGDELRITCPSAERFDAELTAMAELYGSPSPVFPEGDNRRTGESEPPPSAAEDLES